MINKRQVPQRVARKHKCTGLWIKLDFVICPR